MPDEIGERARGDGNGARADRDVGRFDPHQIDKQGHCEHRATAAHQSKNEADEHTGGGRQQILCNQAMSFGFASHSRPLSIASQ